MHSLKKFVKITDLVMKIPWKIVFTNFLSNGFLSIQLISIMNKPYWTIFNRKAIKVDMKINPIMTKNLVHLMLALVIVVETTITKIVTTIPKNKCNTLMSPQETMILDLEIMSPPQEITIIMMLTNHTNVVIVQNNQTCQCYPNLFLRNLKMNTTKAMATGVTKE